MRSRGGPDIVSINSHVCNLVYFIRAYSGSSMDCTNYNAISTYLPTNSRVILPPSHIAHDLPKHVSRFILGPSVAPLNERVCNTNGTWFVTSPKARNGANNLGPVDFDCAVEVSTRVRFRGGCLASSSSWCRCTIDTISSKEVGV